MKDNEKRIYSKQAIEKVIESVYDEGLDVGYDEKNKIYNIYSDIYTNLITNHIHLQDSSDDEVMEYIKKSISLPPIKDDNRYCIIFTKFFDGCRCTPSRLKWLLHRFGAKRIFEPIYENNISYMEFII